MFSQCFTLLMSLVMLQSYIVDTGTLLIMKGPIEAPGVKITDISLTSFQLPTTLNLNYSDETLQFDVGNDCFVGNGTAKVKVSLLPPVPVTGTATLCGAATFALIRPNQTEGYREVDQCVSDAIVPSPNCTLTASVFKGAVRVYEYDLCTLLPELLRGDTVPPSYPSLAPYASPVTGSKILRAVMNIATALGDVSGFSFYVTDIADTALHVEVKAGFPVQVNTTVTPTSIMEWAQLIPGLMKGLQALRSLLRRVLDDPKVAAIVGSMTLVNGPLRGVLELAAAAPPGVSVSFDVIFNDLQCDATGELCTFPAEDGLRIANIAVGGLADVSALIGLASNTLSNVVNTKLAEVMEALCGGDSSPDARCTLPGKDDPPDMAPPLSALIAVPIVFSVAIAASVAVSAWRHRKDPARAVDTGAPLTMRRVLIEDTLFCALVFISAMLFIFSNTSSASSVEVGGEITMYAFSLMNTVTDLWKAGLVPLSIFVMFFSGIYPYVKLAVILLFTVFLRRPEALLLKVIDSIGKYSFIDTFVMLIFVSGLQIPGIADVHVLPSFYLFMTATASSIAAGNYATHLWRRGTTLRHTESSRCTNAPTEEDAKISPRQDSCSTMLISTTSYGLQHCPDSEEIKQYEHAGGEVATPASPPSSTCRGLRRLAELVWWRVSLPAFLLILGLSLPAWISTALSYQVSGLAKIIAPGRRNFSLFSLSLAPDVACAIVSIVTVLIAPLLYALSYPVGSFLGSWASADVLLLACIAGLLQLNQFVQFILGGGFEDIYQADAHLHWPLIPLTIAAVLVWVLQVASMLRLRERLSIWRSTRSKMEVCEEDA